MGWQAFCRDFLWTALMLWPEELPAATLVCLSRQDTLVPTDLVLRHLQITESSAQASTLVSRSCPEPGICVLR